MMQTRSGQPATIAKRALPHERGAAGVRGNGDLGAPARTLTMWDALMRRPALWVTLCAAAIVLVTVASAYLIGGTGTTVYGARSDVLYETNRELSDAASDRARATQVTLVTSRAVLEPVAEQAGASVNKLTDRVSVDLGQDNVLTVTVGDEDPASAELLAGGVISQYVKVAENRTSQARASVLTPAYLLDDPIEPKPVRAIAAGALVGLALASAFVAMVLQARRRL